MFISLPNVIFAVKASAQNVCVFGYQWKMLELSSPLINVLSHLRQCLSGTKLLLCRVQRCYSKFFLGKLRMSYSHRGGECPTDHHSPLEAGGCGSGLKDVLVYCWHSLCLAKTLIRVERFHSDVECKTQVDVTNSLLLLFQSFHLISFFLKICVIWISSRKRRVKWNLTHKSLNVCLDFKSWGVDHIVSTWTSSIQKVCRYIA